MLSWRSVYRASVQPNPGVCSGSLSYLYSPGQNTGTWRRDTLTDGQTARTIAAIVKSDLLHLAKLS